ncbi:MAG: sigma-70 family RNA polymerase sigma factor [Terriglobales bacterium]
MAAHPQPVTSSPVPADEADLVTRVQAGDMSAFEILVARYEHRIFRLAQRMMGNEADAEDVLQETFLKVFTRLHQFQRESRLYTWIVRIAVNEALMKMRRRRKNLVSLDEDISSEEGPIARDFADWRPDPERQYQASELGAILQKCLDALTLPYRIVFQLRDVEQLSTADTAETLGISEAAVKSRLLRARLQLREKLSRHFGVEGA